MGYKIIAISDPFKEGVVKFVHKNYDTRLKQRVCVGACVCVCVCEWWGWGRGAVVKGRKSQAAN